MSEKQRKAIVFAALGVAITWAWFNIGNKTPETKEGYELLTIQPLSPLSSSLTSTSPGGTKTMIDTSTLVGADWGLDPFRSAKTPGRRVTPVLSWKLTGIMFNNSEPMAYVNQKIVKVGDTIDNAKVFKIDKQTVTLKYNDELITLTVSKG